MLYCNRSYITHRRNQNGYMISSTYFEYIRTYFLYYLKGFQPIDKNWRFCESHYSLARGIITQFMLKICCFSFLLNWVVCRCKLGIIHVIMISYLVSLKLELEFVKICCTYSLSVDAYIHISKPQPKGTYYYRILC